MIEVMVPAALVLLLLRLLASWYDERCGSCGREFDYGEQRRRRRVPSAGGRTRLVCQSCADAIDEQQAFEPERPAA